jgi:hypothetical protein
VECILGAKTLHLNFHPVDFHSFVGVTRKSTVTLHSIEKEIV